MDQKSLTDASTEPLDGVEGVPTPKKDTKGVGLRLAASIKVVARWSRRVRRRMAARTSLWKRVTSGAVANGQKLVRRRSRRLRRQVLGLQTYLVLEFQKGALRLRLTERRLRHAAVQRMAKVSATILSLTVIGTFLFFTDQTSDWKVSELHLTSAQVIGAALALVLSLSIIPAQRAAELFSMTILRLYARDNALLGAFILLVGTTLLSLLLGSNWLHKFDAKTSITIQFLLLGISFDALRWFYVRTLDLLVPQTAIQLVLNECNKQLKLASWTAERLLKIQGIAGKDTANHALIRATVISGGHVPHTLRYWTSQLEEFAHRFVARRDTSAVNDILSAMRNIGTQYAEGRRSSVLLHVDPENLFAGGISDIEEVLNPIYESIRLIIADAVSSSNERVVRHAIQQQGELSYFVMSLTSRPISGGQSAPLAFGACYYLDKDIQEAIKASMLDAGIAGIDCLQKLLLARRVGIRTNEMESQAGDALFSVAFAGYGLDGTIWPIRAVGAMLRSVAHEIQIDDYSSIALKDLLERVSILLPNEITADANGKRHTITFPPYSLGFEASIPMLLQMIAGKVELDEKRTWVNPFHDFLSASEELRHHYRSISKIDFRNSLLRKWVVESLFASVRVHLNLLAHPTLGASRHVGDVEDSARALISWTSEFFPSTQPFSKFAAVDAADGLAIMGMHALERGWLDVSRSCVKAIAAMAENSAALQPDSFCLADLQQKIEIVSRASDAVANLGLAAEFRAMIVIPTKVPTSDQSRFLDARATRFRHLDESLKEAGRRQYPRPNDPVEVLHALIARGQSRQRKPKDDGYPM